MHNYYEMSLENGREDIVGRYQKVEKCPLGMWIIEFLDVDWSDLAEKCVSIYKDWQSQIPLSTRFAEFYRELHDSMVTRHPLMRNLFDEELDWCIRSCFGMEDSLTAEEKTYWEDLLKDGTKPVIAERFPRTILKDFVPVFHKLGQTKEWIEEILQAVMEPEEDGRSVVQRYYEYNVENRAHMLRVHELYAEMVPRFNFCIDGRITSGIRSWHGEGEKIDYSTKDLMSAAGTYMVTDNLQALTFWELDVICARNIWIRRCRNCGKWFLPTTVVNCYCSRPLPDNPEKTCKDIGAMFQYQKKVDQNAAKKLLKRVANSVQMYAKRHEEFQPELLRYYAIWQGRAKDLMEQVMAGDLEYEIFEKIINHKTAYILSLKGELPAIEEED